MKCNQCKCLDCLSPSPTPASLTPFSGHRCQGPRHAKPNQPLSILTAYRFNKFACLPSRQFDWQPTFASLSKRPLSPCSPLPLPVRASFSQSLSQLVDSLDCRAFPVSAAAPLCLHTACTAWSWGFLTPPWYPLWELGKIGLILLQMSQMSPSFDSGHNALRFHLFFPSGK